MRSDHSQRINIVIPAVRKNNNNTLTAKNVLFPSMHRVSYAISPWPDASYRKQYTTRAHERLTVWLQYANNVAHDKAYVAGYVAVGVNMWHVLVITVVKTVVSLNRACSNNTTDNNNISNITTDKNNNRNKNKNNNNNNNNNNNTNNTNIYHPCILSVRSC